MPLGILRKCSEGNKSVSRTEQKVKKSECYLYVMKMSYNCKSLNHSLKEKQNLSCLTLKSRTKSLSLILCIKKSNPNLGVFYKIRYDLDNLYRK